MMEPSMKSAADPAGRGLTGAAPTPTPTGQTRRRWQTPVIEDVSVAMTRKTASSTESSLASVKNGS